MDLYDGVFRERLTDGFAKGGVGLRACLTSRFDLGFSPKGTSK